MAGVAGTGASPAATLSCATLAARIARAMRACVLNVDAAWDWIHPDWCAPVSGMAADASAGIGARLACAPPAHQRACSRALLRASGYRLPPFEALVKLLSGAPGVDVRHVQHEPHAPEAPEAPRISPSPDGPAALGESVGPAISRLPLLTDLLPLEAGLRLLRLRALIFRQDELRRLIDRESRQRVAAWSGGLVAELSASGEDVDVPGAALLAQLVAEHAMPALQTLDDDSLAVEGYFLFARDFHALHASRGKHGAIAAGLRTPEQTLLRRALPRSAGAPRWIGALPSQADRTGAVRTLALPHAIPAEWTWLCG